VPTFVDRGVPRGQRGGSSTVVNLSSVGVQENQSEITDTLYTILLFYGYFDFTVIFHWWIAGINSNSTLHISEGTH
jgi:hypothetical protein